MRYTRITRYALFLMIAMVLPMMFSAGSLPKAHAPTTGTQYYLTPVPVVTQEGYTIVLVLTVIGALPSTTYQFDFQTKDPSGKVWTSSIVTENTTASETSFSKLITYPSPNFIGTNSLCCTYNAQANQIKPLLMTNVASTPFGMILTDRNPAQYQRTETVGIRASGYNASESVAITIRTFTTSTLVFSQTLPATAAGIVSTSWKVPKNATIDDYIVTVTGTTTRKSPPDAQGFAVSAATITIPTLTSSKTIYQRTETMSFSFQASYPDGSLANSGIGLLTLAPPTGGNITLTANYDSLSQSFFATYKTFLDNQTGTWTATIAAHAYGDGYGNAGPSSKLTNAPQLVPATLAINIVATSYVPIGQQVKLNATVTYPDGTTLTTGTGVKGYLVYTGTPAASHIVPLTFDTGFQHWIGSYAPQTSDPGGLWSLIVNATDSPTPPNKGSASTAVTLQDRPPIASFTSTPSSAPTGTSITFDGTASYDLDGTVVSYSWAFGDGATGTGSIVTHSYSPAKSYTVTLTVTDNGGATGSTTSQVTITDRPPVVSFMPSPATANTGQTITLSINVSDPDGTISTTRIDWGDAMTQLYAGAITSATHSYSSTGASTSQIFTIVITATDNNASYTSTSGQVTIYDRIPVPSFNPSLTSLITKQNVTLTISANDPDGTVVSLRVDWGDGTIDTLLGTATSDTHSYASTGTSTSKTFTITVNATDNSGSTGKYSSQVTVSDRPPVITFTASPSSLSTGQTVTVTMTSSDPDGTISSTKVDWGDGTVDTLTGAPQRDTHQYTSTGSASSKTFAIAITVTDNSGSTSAPSTSTVSVQASSQSPSGNLSLPLYYFAILAAVVAALLVGGFLAFRRHKITHANLKIDLEAVKSEAGRIENQEFFQSVKDQLKKDKDD